MKIKITYTTAEKALFERVLGELLQIVPDTRQHTSTTPAGLTIWYLTSCNKARSVVK